MLEKLQFLSDLGTPWNPPRRSGGSGQGEGSLGLPADIPVGFPADILQSATQQQLFPLLCDMLLVNQS